MTRVARWKRGNATLWRVVDEWLAGGPPAQELAESERRKVVRLRTDEGGDLVVKRFLPKRGVQRLIGVAQRGLALSSGQREWRALSRLRSVGSNVPAPLALALLDDGGELLISSFIEGTPLLECLAGAVPARRRLLTALGDQVALLHASGVAHRDLHAGNFVVNAQGQPVLLDFQRARSTRSARARRKDLAAFDFSLSQAALSVADRMRFRSAALGISGRATDAERLTLRRVGLAATQHATRHYRSRTRRCLRAGRLYAHLNIEGRTGLRLRSVPGEVIERALAIHAAVQSGEGELSTLGSTLKRDQRSRVTATEVGGRAVVIKEVVKPGRGRLLADAFRGSPARRAWVGGHGLLARGIGAATPLAFVEVRRLFIPVSSLLVLEDLRPARPANEPDSASRNPDELAEALRRLAVRLHTRCVVHGDLQAPHIFLSQRGDSLESTLIDLEGVRFRRRLTDDERIQSLAELNASIADDLLSPEQRQLAFERYAQVLPFGEGEAARSERLAAEQKIVRRSLARRHLWKGEGCRVAADARPGPPGPEQDSSATRPRGVRQ